MLRIRRFAPTRSALVLLPALLLATATGPALAKSSVNKGLSLDAGETLREGLETVNGGIDVGRDAIVEGDVESVNGGIILGDRADVRGVESVNGGISLGSEVRVRDDIETTNGSIEVATGSQIDGDIESVNGRVRLEGTQVGGDIETTSGPVQLLGGSRVGGNLEIRKAGGWSWFSGAKKPLRLEIAENSVLAGDLIVDEQDRRVEICLRDGGRVEGEIRGAIETCR